MRILFITQPDKKQFAVDGVEGATLMETAVQNEVPGILAECGGACSCATCHVIIDDSWIDRVGYPNSMEEDMLDFAYETQDNSRLSCQIVLDGTMDGMIVHVPSRQA
ncbi:2Fe-2S iron-sulfur cluster-binding protein [Bartonella sp. LJL80]